MCSSAVWPVLSGRWRAASLASRGRWQPRGSLRAAGLASRCGQPAWRVAAAAGPKGCGGGCPPHRAREDPARVAERGVADGPRLLVD
jgi:hypothetical protein